jgi:rod shape-determining protein MreC
VLSRKKSLNTFLSIILVLVVSISLPFLRNHLIDSLRWPLQFFSALAGEIRAAVLYHHNLTQNRQLKKEIGLMQRRLFEAEELYLDNLRLRQMLDFKEKSVFPLSAAGVIGYDPSNLSSIIVINKGKQQGIEKDFTVITNQGLAGRVIQAGSLTSQVLLINDLNSGVAAFIQRSRQKGLVSGTLAGSLRMHYLPPDADVQVSDLVVTSGLSGLYPKGILIGQVTRVQRQGKAGEISALVKPAVDLSRLEEVLVVLRE